MSEGLDHFLQLLVIGVVTGGIYALIAMGFVVVYKATGSSTSPPASS